MPVPHLRIRSTATALAGSCALLVGLVAHSPASVAAPPQSTAVHAAVTTYDDTYYQDAIGKIGHSSATPCTRSSASRPILATTRSGTP